jgi:cholesterol transport system auxiliary component
MKSLSALWIIAALLAGLGSSCISLERSYPEKRFYVLEVRAPAANGEAMQNEILQVSTLRISPRYQDRSFVYRISDGGFETDFYNQFIAPPAGLISEEIRKGLIGAQLFKYVTSASNGIYGDFRNLSAPTAVIDLEFFLTSDVPAKPGVLMQKRYVQSVPVSSRSPEALIKSWDLALEQIITTLTADIRNTANKL